MKKLTVICLLFANPLFSQYYLRGEVRDALNNPLHGVRILLHSKGTYPFYSGSSGGFGIPVSVAEDTITLVAEGFEMLKTAVATSDYRVFKLKAAGPVASNSHVRLSSFTKDFSGDRPHYPNIFGESYSATVENEFIATSRFPQTGFAVNVDRASYSNIRRFLNTKSRPPTDAVRLEELLNYFNFRTAVPPFADNVFAVNTTLTACPWKPGNQLLYINLQAKKLQLDHTPPSNLVFLIDASGSMDMDNRMPLLQSAFKLLVENLRSQDTVSIIIYGGSVAVALQPTSGSDKQKIIEAIESLKPSGSTPGESAIRLAYKYARNTYIKGGNNRVILATDGDFNVGQTSEEELEKLIEQQRHSGIYLTCLGVGMGNYKDSKLETLAKKGNGNFAYLDNVQEAEKVLVEEFAQTLYTVASGVYLDVHFNPELVKSYRLIGFDNKQSAIEDSSSQLEGGEVGSGHKLLSVFEIEPAAGAGTAAQTIARIVITHRNPKTREVNKQEISAPNRYVSLASADSCLRFASAVIMFGNLVKQSKYAGNISWDDVYNLALSGADPANQLHTGFLDLVQKAKKLYGSKKRKA